MLAWTDYLGTASAELGAAYATKLRNNTMAQYRDATGVIGKIPVKIGFAHDDHIVGWDPAPAAGTFSWSDHMTPCNAWAVRGLEALSEMARASGSLNMAAEAAATAASLKASMLDKMWNRKTGRFCDGLCADPKVINVRLFPFSIFMFTSGRTTFPDFSAPCQPHARRVAHLHHPPPPTTHPPNLTPTAYRPLRTPC